MDLRTEKGVIHMLAVKSMDVRDNFKNFCEKVINGETLIISRPKMKMLLCYPKQNIIK